MCFSSLSCFDATLIFLLFCIFHLFFFYSFFDTKRFLFSFFFCTPHEDSCTEGLVCIYLDGFVLVLKDFLFLCEGETKFFKEKKKGVLLKIGLDFKFEFLC